MRGKAPEQLLHNQQLLIQWAALLLLRLLFVSAALVKVYGDPAAYAQGCAAISSTSGWR